MSNSENTQPLFQKIISSLQGPAMVLWMLLLMGYGLITLIAGGAGIANAAGPIWAGVALVAALVFRFTLPITIGAFLAATNMWGWHWFFALLFVAPGLLFMIPGLILAVVEGVTNKR